MADAAPLAALSAAPQVLRIEGRGMLTIRADAADGPAVAAALGLPAPAPRRIVREGDRALAWMSPDEWLLMAPKADLAPVHDRLREALNGRHALVLDVTAARARIRHAGPGGRAGRSLPRRLRTRRLPPHPPRPGRLRLLDGRG